MIERDEVFRIKTVRRAGTLGHVLEAIARFDAHIGEIETLTIQPDYNIRDITVIAPDESVVGQIAAAIASVPGVEIVGEPIDRVFQAHRGGKLKVEPNVEINTLQDMREIYTPGVARVSSAIYENPELAKSLTWKGKTVAVVSDGSRVLGLGNIGPEASLPVMEGKALFYSRFVDLNAVPLVLATQDPEEIIETVIRVTPGFGGIHLEDIASPGVYEIERRLEDALDIPVFHDDQHGTAVVLLAAVLSAAIQCERSIDDLVFGQIGLGAAGSAIARLAAGFPFKAVHAFDPSPDASKRLAGEDGTIEDIVVADPDGGMDDVLAAADVVVLTTGRAGLLKPERVRKGQIIMALSNPEPEIERGVALAAGAALASDGSIVNNVLAFPGIFRGALDAGASRITTRMKREAAQALADLVPEDDLLPDPLDRSVHHAVAARVRRAAAAD